MNFEHPWRGEIFEENIKLWPSDLLFMATLTCESPTLLICIKQQTKSMKNIIDKEYKWFTDPTRYALYKSNKECAEALNKASYQLTKILHKIKYYETCQHYDFGYDRTTKTKLIIRDLDHITKTLNATAPTIIERKQAEKTLSEIKNKNTNQHQRNNQTRGDKHKNQEQENLLTNSRNNLVQANEQLVNSINAISIQLDKNKNRNKSYNYKPRHYRNN